MPPLTMTIFGRPQQRGSKKPFLIRTRSGAYATRKSGSPVIAMTDTNVKSNDWMAQVRSVAAAEMNGKPLMTGPIVLSATFYFARPQSHYGTGRNAAVLKSSAPEYHAQTPDLAKLMRCLEDAMTGVVWRDDRQVFRYERVLREWTELQERAEVTITEVTE